MESDRMNAVPAYRNHGDCRMPTDFFPNFPDFFGFLLEGGGGGDVGGTVSGMRAGWAMREKKGSAVGGGVWSC